MDSSSSQEKKSIPRFASFKPLPAPPPTADRPPPSRQDEDRSRHRSKHHSRHRGHRDRSRSRGHRRDHREHRHVHKEAEQDRREFALREPIRESRSLTKSVPKESEHEESDLYVIDRKGDKYNVIYGTIHRYNIPLYHRVGRGNVLGLPRSYKIQRDTVEGDALVIKPDAGRTDAARTKVKRVLAGLNKQQTKLLRIRQPSPSDADADAMKDYLPLECSRSRRQRSLGDLGSDDENYAYRSIHGKAKPEDDLPSDFEAVSDESSGDEVARVDPDQAIKQRNVDLTRRVDKNPSDVGSWLQLIDHQESLLRGSERESASLTSAEKKSLADVKLSLYQKALKLAGQCPSRDRLLLGMLEEGAKLWDTKKLSTQWQAVLKSNAHFISLWVKYLDFRQTEFLDFTYERCLATFLDCLRLNKTAPDTPGKLHVQVYLFLRMTAFIREAGFTEQAVGLWQAMLELTFFRPPTLDDNTDREAILSALMDFWESEVTRIGETGAKGWRNGGGAAPNPKVFSPGARVNPRSIFASWETCERERMFAARLPCRSLDESEDDDPFRVILSSDLREIISLVWDPDAADELIDSFLYFCSLPPLVSPQNSGMTGRWAGDSFLQNYFTNSTYSTLDDWLPRQHIGSAELPIFFPHQNFIHTTQALFANQETWFYSFRAWTQITSRLRSDLDPDWVRRVLRLLVEAMPLNEDLAEYTLAVEFACNSREAKKYAKSLLKKRPSSLRLYNSYALMEQRSGNLAAADHVWATSLSMSIMLPGNDRTKAVLLWHMWIWESLEARNIARASHLLLSMPENSVDLKTLPDASSQPAFSPTGLLKVQSETVLAASNANVFVACTNCLAILQYLVHSLDLNKSQEAYCNAINRLAVMPSQAKTFRSFTTELLHQSRARLLYHHVQTSSIYKPSDIRTLLMESISLFPHNTMFLSLFAWNESRIRIEERVRDTLRDITTKPQTSANLTLTSAEAQVPVTSHLFSIYTELSRPVYAGSTSHSVRAAFEKAITGQDTLPSSTTSSSSSSNARSNLTLWKLYLLFELSHNNIHRAKDVFYRGMRACPWSKELIMLAFSHLRTDSIQERYSGSSWNGEGMGFDELRRVYNVLVEKELRVHVDIENQLDELVTKMQGRSVALGIPFSMPEDVESYDNPTQV
ncbi:hypothetical protein EYZ11_003347 [Aspergillus tanneri]|uniref:DUF1740-domain-containing protein n=1 Tax=Aspergillus tanneri TaxID=1220188 RepID=A0A4S3JNL8_9EURO|nr:hypothetical protein EYZ11_003347 [Aspergillus tanneri]